MLTPLQNVYLTSSDLRMVYQSQRGNKDTNILTSIPIDQPWGNLIKSVMNITSNWIDESGTQLDTIIFGTGGGAPTQVARLRGFSDRPLPPIAALGGNPTSPLVDR